jgi:hypothetical protein
VNEQVNNGIVRPISADLADGICQVLAALAGAGL